MANGLINARLTIVHFSTAGGPQSEEGHPEHGRLATLPTFTQCVSCFLHMQNARPSASMPAALAKEKAPRYHHPRATGEEPTPGGQFQVEIKKQMDRSRKARQGFWATLDPIRLARPCISTFWWGRGLEDLFSSHSSTAPPNFSFLQQPPIPLAITHPSRASVSTIFID